MKSFYQLAVLCSAVFCLVPDFLAAQNAPSLPPRNRPGLNAPALPPRTTAPSPAPLPPPAPSPGSAQPSSGKNIIGFTATPLSEVLGEYFRVTGRRVLKDRGLENATVTIEVPGEFSDEEYRTIIEKGLLMHGYALVPSGENLFKLVAAEQGTSPSSQGVPLVLRAEDLPTNDQVVTHVIQLNYLQAEEASTAFQQLIPLHPYGKILAVANGQSLIITEASQTIRAYLDLARQVDAPPMETIHKTVRLERAEAAQVVDQLNSLLGVGKDSGNRPATAKPAGAARPPGATGSSPASSVSASMGGGASATPEAFQPVIEAVERTNSLIIVARPVDMRRIDSFIADLDAPSHASRYYSRRLKYLDLTVFLGLAEKALQRTSQTKVTSSLPQQNTSATPTTPVSNFGGNSGFGGSGFGGSSGMGGGTAGGIGSAASTFGAGSITPLEVTKKPVSVLIGSTFVIADTASSKFIATGPPDQIKALEELADEMDVRPRQILLSAIIGEFTLGNNFNFGLDWIQSLKKVGDNGLVGGVLNTQGTAFANPANLKDIAGFLGAGNPAALAGLTAYGQINKNLNVFLQTLESTQRFHVLQKPTITALNHQSASIYIGQQIAIAGQSYTSGVVGGGFTSNTQYIPVRLQLDITAHIFNDNEVMLEFKQQNNDVSGFSTISGNQVPNISEQGMHNSLIVPDQATAMLGGLITERDTNNKSGLPFLVRIPVLKHLFGSTNSKKERREMMIFVQPRILPDSESHMFEQAKIGDYSSSFDQTERFAGMPEEIVPRATPVRENQPNALLPPPPAVAAEPKKGLFSKMKGWFGKPKE
ncbi:secretin N-terminal domain-containing protein [Prosthecobacter sp.]|uniref:secretin N-terminal domain-containing protein n=1 Tax=Prosthecobacter sp. TaxID=1965333 RepID=UPI0037845697